MDNLKLGDVLLAVDGYRNDAIPIEDLTSVIEAYGLSQYSRGVSDERDDHWCNEN